MATGWSATRRSLHSYRRNVVNRVISAAYYPVRDANLSDALELKGDPMATRTLRYVVGAALLLSMCAGAAMTVDTTTLVDASSTVAARYHLRSRTSNFYRRASSTRSTGTGVRIFGR
jgi:hypothetical protein